MTTVSSILGVETFPATSMGGAGGGQAREESLDALVVRSQVAEPVARLRAHLHHAAIGGGPYLDDEVVPEMEQRSHRDALDRTALRIAIGQGPSVHLGGHCVDLSESLIGIQ